MSCNESNNNSQIERFEKILGEPERVYLDEIITDFNYFLDSKYKEKSTASKFNQYLIEILESDTADFWRIDTNKLDKYKQCNLFNKYDTVYPD